MADTIYGYQIDGILTDPNGMKTSIDGSFDVDYTTTSVQNVQISGYNIGFLSSSTNSDGTTEYSVTLQYFPQGPYLINYANISYDTVYPPYADSASVTTGATTNPFGIAVGSDTYSGQEVPLVARAESVCCTTGTLIRTSRGEVAIENLRTGDLVVTASGAARPIIWIGRRTINCRRHPRPAAVMPVRIAAHLFGDDRPARDLLVSPGHAICVDVIGEVLIPASALVNGTTILQEQVEQVTYWHLELDSHDIVLAENLPCESYIEMGNRDFFEGSIGTTLHGSPDVAAVTHADFCRPFHAAGAVVAFVRDRLEAKAARAGWTLVDDPLAGLHLVADGCRIEPEVRDLSARFMVPTNAKSVWLVSATTVPAQVGRGADLRTLGVCVARIVVDDGFASTVIAADDPRLLAGFHQLEEGPQRWTDGCGCLPSTLWETSRGGFFLRVDLARPALPRWVGPAALVMVGDALAG